LGEGGEKANTCGGRVFPRSLKGQICSSEKKSALEHEGRP